MKFVFVFLALFGFALTRHVVKDDIECPAVDPQGTPIFFPHEENCWQFYECNQGKPVLYNCSGSYWNQDKKICDYPSNVDCGNLKTTEVPTTRGW